MKKKISCPGTCRTREQAEPGNSKCFYRNNESHKPTDCDRVKTAASSLIVLKDSIAPRNAKANLHGAGRF